MSFKLKLTLTLNELNYSLFKYIKILFSNSLFKQLFSLTFLKMEIVILIFQFMKNFFENYFKMFSKTIC